MFGSKRFKKIKQQGDVIFKSRFLENLTPLERSEFLQYCHRRQYKEDEYVYYQGDPGSGMYFIEEGKVELVVEPEPSRDAETQNYEISAPECLGALSIGYDLRRLSSAKCLTECTLLGFFKPDFETLKKRQPLIAVKFMETLAMLAMKQLEAATNELKQVSSPERLHALQFRRYFTQEEETI